MIVLDTSVLSELMRAKPDRSVLDWFAGQPDDLLYTTAITQAEVLFGLALLPLGARRDRLESAAGALFEEDFANRVLPFDSQAAAEYARICSSRRSQGRPVNQMDAQIAAIARAHRASLATRDAAGFDGLKISLFNPFAGRSR